MQDMQDMQDMQNMQDMQDIEQISNIFNDDYFNPNTMAQLLYSAILNGFRIKIGVEERKIYSTYLGYMYDLVEYLRDEPIEKIKDIMKYLLQKDPYVVDNVIMLWCFPRSGLYMSKMMYYRAYTENIKNYADILFEMRNEDFVIHFCLDIISKPSQCPIHCVDIIWNCLDINRIKISSIVIDKKKQDDFIEFNLDEETTDTEISISLNAVRIYNFNLGNKPNQNGKSFNDMINFISRE